MRNYYATHPKYREQLRKAEKQRRKQNAIWFYWFKHSLRGCERCGETDWRTLDFHHRDPQQKLGDVPKLLASGRSLKVVLHEIEKCDVLCANCHRKETYGKETESLYTVGYRV
jgi:hypothetical protein